METIVAVLLVFSGLVALTSALGLARLPDFFLRMHAPALVYTLASWAVTLASVIYFSAGRGGLALHSWLIIIILSITAPVSTVLLSRAALFRERQAGQPLPPPLRASGEGGPPSK
ncbi:MAG TPA: monovalent cation/H(+) antiporter subunit G [Ramlibacter sp.]|uniref:monovalent cation/H(+) antiporter subunit G n=1 Tax=Ramlibacter sp. TaxID=1917967 RepID=UPI002D7E7502|nr:monovalent cation/H(+) antiporter subunit G [Ramlibacter sp.]HET8746963.1 monovalent cation/H(+) antiporter subunit G [Ramlibacter sp.]